MIAFLAVLVVMAVLDFVWAEYTKATTSKQPLRASFLAVAIIGCSGFVTTSYVENHWMLVAAAIGSFAGTYLSVRRTS